MNPARSSEGAGSDGETARALHESEERFAGAFEEAPIGVALVAPDGRWLKVNRAVCALLGYSETELLARTFQDLTHPADLTADLEYVRRMLAGEIRHYEMEKRYVHARGHLVTVLLTVSLVRDAKQQPLYFISQIQDITARRRAEDALRESNEKFQQLAGNITDTFWIRSPDGRTVEYVSPAFEKIWGRPVTALTTEPHRWTEFILPEDRDRVCRRFEALTQDARNIDIEYRIVRPDETVRWVHLRGFQVRDPADKLIRLTGIVTDITERKSIEQALRESEEHFRFLHELGEGMRTLTAPGEILAATVRLLGGHLRASRCTYARVAKDGERFTVQHEFRGDGASAACSYPLSLFGPQTVSTLRQGQTLILRNVDAEFTPAEGGDRLNALGIKAAICCPLIRDGVWEALITVTQTIPVIGNRPRLRWCRKRSGVAGLRSSEWWRRTRCAPARNDSRRCSTRRRSGLPSARRRADVSSRSTNAFANLSAAPRRKWSS